VDGEISTLDPAEARESILHCSVLSTIAARATNDAELNDSFNLLRRCLGRQDNRADAQQMEPQPGLVLHVFLHGRSGPVRELAPSMSIMATDD
jgi:hypothetical protein